MIDPRHQELIHRLMDGEITADEQTELNRCLEESAGARAFYERMLLLKEAGETRQDVAAPESLKAGVMREIHRVQSGSPAAGSWWDDVRRVLRPILIPRVAYGVAAGLIVGFAVGALTLSDTSGPSLSNLDFSGTLGLPHAAGQQHIDDAKLREPGVMLDWTANRLGDQILLHIELVTEATTRMELRFDDEQLVAQGLSQGGPDVAHMELTRGAIRATHIGNGSFTVLLHAAGEVNKPIELQLLTEGATYRQTISLTPPTQ